MDSHCCTDDRWDDEGVATDATGRTIAHRVLGVHWGLYRQCRPEVIVQATQALSDLVDAASITPEVSSVLPFEQAPAGLAALAAGRPTGRIVVTAP